MRILIYCAHPSQYHFYKGIIAKLKINGHKVKLAIKAKDILVDLVKEDEIDYFNILPKPTLHSKFSSFVSLIKRDIRLYKAAKDFMPDILIGSDACNTHVAWLLNIPGFVIGEDDYSIVKKLHWLMMPFASAVLTPELCNLGPFERKKIPFQGFIKLAYLHPDVFKPDKRFISEYGLNSPYCIVRLVRLTAHHDGRIKGIDRSLLNEIIPVLNQAGINIYIDSEGDFPEEFSSYRLNINKTHFHHIMAFAHLVISDSQSLSVESAMLGVPSIRINGFAGKISVLEELEHHYGLTFGVQPTEKEKIIKKIREILSDLNYTQSYRNKRDKMLEDKINVHEFFVWFLDNFPASWNRVNSKTINNEFMDTLYS